MSNSDIRDRRPGVAPAGHKIDPGSAERHFAPHRVRDTPSYAMTSVTGCRSMAKVSRNFDVMM